jgi:hypothetical protein
MTFTITFQESENVTNPGQDGVQYSFPFIVVDSALVGTPEEKSQTQSRRIIVSISRSRLAAWRLSDEDLAKVLFEYGKRHVADLVRSNRLSADHTIRCPTITTVSHPDLLCPFDPALIDEPAGVSINVEQQKPRIGFHAQ